MPWRVPRRSSPCGASPPRNTSARLERSQDLTISITVNSAPVGATVDVLAPIPFPVTIWANVTLGSGSSAADYKVRADAFQSFPVSGTFARVTIYVGDLLGNSVSTTSFVTPPPLAQVSVQVARCTRALPARPAVWLNNVGVEAAAGIISSVPLRTASMRAHITGAAAGPLWIQFFDQDTTPVNGDVPTTEFYLPSAAPLSDVGELTQNLRGWAQGIAYAVSSTSGVLTLSAAEAFVEAQQALL